MGNHAPNFHWIYIPHLDYAGQKFGPNSSQAQDAIRELDRALGEFAQAVAATAMGKRVAYLVVGEYAMTDVSGVIYPNRLLREAGLLAVRHEGGREYLDLKNSAAFAMVDHQFAHVFVHSHQNPERKRQVSRVVDLFKDVVGIVGVYAGDDRVPIGMDHPRSGDVVLVCDDAYWLAYYWWFDDALAPPFARTVDIHRKPGYDPVELFFDPATKGIPLNAALVKGSHGVPATQAKHRTALICSIASRAVQPGGVYRDTDVKRISLELLGLGVDR
jgi:hypothetical protein